MRKTGAILVLTMALFCAATSGFAKPAKSEGTEGAFAKLKQLQGNWIGTHKTEKGDERFPVSYTLSSGDSILVEKIHAGQKKEMMSVYHPAGNSILMTHYCMLGNQPRMRLAKQDGNVFQFTFQDGSNMGRKDPHMHDLKITLEDDGHFSQEWGFSENGKVVKTEVFHYVRKK